VGKWGRFKLGKRVRVKGREYSGKREMSYRWKKWEGGSLRLKVRERLRACCAGSRWRAIRVKKSPCGCSLRFVLVPKEKWKSPCNFTKSLW
jgi:hypothetical protein